MKADLQRAYAWQGYCRKLAVSVASELNNLHCFFAILHPYLRKRKGLVLIDFLHAWIAYLDSTACFFTLEIIKELLIRLIHSLKTILKDLTMKVFEHRVYLLPLRQHILLVAIGNRFPQDLICLLALHYRERTVLPASSPCGTPEDLSGRPDICMLSGQRPL